MEFRERWISHRQWNSGRGGQVIGSGIRGAADKSKAVESGERLPSHRQWNLGRGGQVIGSGIQGEVGES